MHVPDSTLKSTSIESVKYPLENRIWYSYLGQTNSIYAGTSNQPVAIGRVLDDGTTQLSRFAYDASGFRLTSSVDPLGRTTGFAYAANGIDLVSIAQAASGGMPATIAQFSYDGQHRPLTFVDAAGQTTVFTYNAAGQLATVTDPLNETTAYQYDPSANLTTVTNANNATAATYTYDAYGRVATRTDSEGWTLAYAYDAADRITRLTYPDGTARSFAWDKLDLASYTDRQSRTWTFGHDANRRLTSITDPLGQPTAPGYDEGGRLTSLTDAKSHTTSWAYDVEGRLTTKQYADASTQSYVYETTTRSRTHKNSRWRRICDSSSAKEHAMSHYDLSDAEWACWAKARRMMARWPNVCWIMSAKAASSWATKLMTPTACATRSPNAAGWADIPSKSNRRDPAPFSAFLYRYRNLIERFHQQAEALSGHCDALRKTRRELPCAHQARRGPTLVAG